MPEDYGSGFYLIIDSECLAYGPTFVSTPWGELAIDNPTTYRSLETRGWYYADSTSEAVSKALAN